jgi:dsDNA-specific endonuclease/ATPase MutS2
MERIHFLAAEIFSYSYANYDDHLGINERFDTLMPRDAEMLETALNEQWPIDKVAQELDASTETARKFLFSVKEALEVVDAKNPAESFRNAVRQSIEVALKDGLAGTEAIESLVTQICYRAANLGFVLDKKGQHLSQYSRHLRKDPETEYYEGYFEEPFEE